MTSPALANTLSATEAVAIHRAACQQAFRLSARLSGPAVLRGDFPPSFMAFLSKKSM
jgi:hypothetical protein